MDPLDSRLVFIVGSPRSGTTILGEILDLHPDIRQWYEPYFMWDKYFRLSPDDVRTENDATAKVKNQIRKSFDRFARKSGASFIVDKSPRNSLKIPFINKIFPGARFIHIIRDGRDATLSINREWIRRLNIVEGAGARPGFDYFQAFRVIKKWLSRQPFIMDRLRALWFETHGHFLNRKKHLNRLRWNGRVGWGPRFRDWEKILNSNTLLQFNAHQWAECVNRASKSLEELVPEQKMSIMYEDFVQQPGKVLDDVLGFIGAPDDPEFYNRLPEMKKANFNKWRQAFSNEEIGEIRPILTPVLEEFGYLEKWPW
ncbi:MAG: sulfotransferase [Desulfonatronovibrio sp.]